MSTVPYVRVVLAISADAAVEQAKVLARTDGYTVRTLRTVRCDRTGDMPIRLPEWRVELAVLPKAVEA